MLLAIAFYALSAVLRPRRVAAPEPESAVAVAES